MNLEQAREVLLTHSRSNKNGRFPHVVTHQQQITNPICGDHVEVKMNTAGTQIIEIGFLTKACAICSASASLMSELVRGQSFAAALYFAQEFENHILASVTLAWPASLDALKSFEHLKVNHSRRACALLPWVALKSALKEIRA